jgi:hypothetical protein
MKIFKKIEFKLEIKINIVNNLEKVKKIIQNFLNFFKNE